MRHSSRKPMPAPGPESRVSRRGYGGRSAQELLQERRERLMAAGLTLFCSVGFQHTRIDAICAEAKVTPRHFYEQFDTREALLLAIYEQVVAHARSQVQAALQTPGLMPADLINEAIRAFVRAYTEDARHARLACVEVVGVSADMARRRRAVIHEFAGLIEAYANAMVQSGLLPKRDYGLSCLAMVGAVNELMCEWLMGEDPPSVAALTDELLSMFAALILGARALLPDA